MSKPSRQSLVEFGATQKVGGCWLCGLPERQEVEDAVLAGQVTKAGAGRWLRDVCGYEQATIHRIESHFANHVQRPA